MAERRMFAKTIIDSDAFIDMPLSTQALYFHLSMRADDDGFINNPKKIQRMIGASDDDLKMLVAKRFIIPFESGIVVIKHWKIHNYIRGDRKKETVYPEEMSLLAEKENGAYTLKAEEPIAIEPPKIESARQRAYRESSLPYSFEYKIRQAFSGEICPVCGYAMRGNVDECGITSDNRRPTIQHNLPISKGGKHELGNISVICHQCNVTLQDMETGRLNSDEVIKKWDDICMSGKCRSSDRQVTDKCQHRLGKDSIGQVRLEKDNTTTTNNNHSFLQSEEFKLFHRVCEAFRNCGAKSNPEDFIAYNEAREWKGIGGESVLDNLERYVTRWEKREIGEDYYESKIT